MNQADSNNQYGINTGGWKSSYMRTSIIPSFKQALSSDLRSVLKTVIIYSDNTGGFQDNSSNVTSTTDDIYLAAEFEVFGSKTNANSVEQNYQTQFTYYKNGNGKAKYKYSDLSRRAGWWERSPFIPSKDSFCYVYFDGSATGSSASNSFGFAPVFKV